MVGYSVENDEQALKSHITHHLEPLQNLETDFQKEVFYKVVNNDFTIGEMQVACREHRAMIVCKKVFTR